jgi:hypothetical protein
LKTLFGLVLFLFLINASHAQTITGAWRGKIGSANAELKLIKKGDSLLGTSYYYTSHNKYRRYAVRGYFDANTNAVVIWDDEMLEDRLSGRGEKEALLSVADFNCPGEDNMRLDGESSQRDDKDKNKGTVQLQKVKRSGFPDEWDFVLENYIYGANDPYIIDSIDNLRRAPKVLPEIKERELAGTRVKPVEPPITDIAVHTPVAASPQQSSNYQKYASREKKLATVIPVHGDSIELRFYDNAVVDGDSIAVFLNDKMLFEHVRLNNKPFTFKLSVKDLLEDNEMVMVAENLGTIPPNTSLMVVEIDGNRYEARLESTANTSALIRFIKQKPKKRS